MNKFKHRKVVHEIIDDFNWSGNEMENCLDDIEWINKNLGGINISARPILHYIQMNLRKNLKIADIGCGSGDVLKKIQSACEGIKRVDLIGVDANKNILDYARRKHFMTSAVTLVHADIIEHPELIPEADIYMMDLFLHHFEEAQIHKIITGILRFRPSLMVINDLQRSKIAYFLFGLLRNMINMTPAAFNDGSLSVLKGFNKTEMESIGKMAPGYHFHVRWRWAFRWQLIIQRN